ncbi:MAG: ABC transporter substrate-binding protein [Roseovarius sp.]
MPATHPTAPRLVDLLRSGRIGRRDFLAHATAFGMAAPVASLLAGGPARAQPAMAEGGTLRIQQSVRALRDPRSFDWSEMANQTRGFLEYLVEYQSDGSFTGMLLENWEVNDDASRYLLHLRPGVTWNNGDPFTPEDVIRNLARWCDTGAEGNSMASRLTGMIDPETGQMRPDAAVAEGDLSVAVTLSAPDITFIATLSDYPAAILHASYDGTDPFPHAIGTGPYRPVRLEPGIACVLERNTEHEWWGSAVFGGPWLDRIEFLDYGTDPSDWAAAAAADEIDMLYESVGDFIDVMDALGWTQTSTETAATIVIRANSEAEIGGERPYAEAAVRRALALAVDNEICLELGYAGRGTVAANHHVSPLHPAYANIGPALYAPGDALAGLREAGLAEMEHELITVDDEWQRNTGDAVAALMRDTGLNVRRTLLPGNIFWENWKSYPFSATQWNHRPLDVQVLALAYRSGAAWNETGFANAEFDRLLDAAMAQPDPEARRPIVEQLETILRDEGVIIQPYWRTLFNHHNGKVVGADKHPANELHLHRMGFAA